MSQDLAAKREEIPDADHADQSSTFEHRYMPDVMAVHQVEHLGNIIVGLHEMIFVDMSFEIGILSAAAPCSTSACRTSRSENTPTAVFPSVRTTSFTDQSTNILSSERPAYRRRSSIATLP